MFKKYTTEIQRSFAKQKFTKIHPHSYLSVIDSQAIAMLKLLEIDVEVLETIKNSNSDFFTFYGNTDDEDIDLTLFLFIGQRQDHGFVCIYLSEIIKYRTNLLKSIDLVLERQKSFNRNAIISAILEMIEEKIEDFKEKKVAKIETDKEVYFKYEDH